MLVPQSMPLSLYVHVPWCVRKCPYCDFNSHQIEGGTIDAVLETHYLDALLADFEAQLPLLDGRSLGSVFVGGGTPSLLSAQAYRRLFAQIGQWIEFAPDCEITMEANPGTLEHAPFEQYLAAGINRLSIGVQSFKGEHLAALGRIHDGLQAKNAIRQARAAGFQRINIDLMHGLPMQTSQDALDDIDCAIAQGASHLSWYQLTIEPNTVFFRTQPILPDDERLADIQAVGEARLQHAGFLQYEVSAWTREQPSQHNLNYWQFGDYVAIGAGAHGKLTQTDGIYRYQKSRLPKDYLAHSPAKQGQWSKIAAEDLPFEFMMNALRLKEGVASNLFSRRTGLDFAVIAETVADLRARQLLVADDSRLQCTPLGWRYLNTVLDHFL